MLGRETTAQHIVGVGEDLDAQTVQVGVRDAGSQEEGLTRGEPDVVQQEGGDDTGVLRVEAADRRVGTEGGLDGHGKVRQGGAGEVTGFHGLGGLAEGFGGLSDRRGHGLGIDGEHRGEGRLEGFRLGLLP